MERIDAADTCRVIGRVEHGRATYVWKIKFGGLYHLARSCVLGIQSEHNHCVQRVIYSNAPSIKTGDGQPDTLCIIEG